MPELNLPITIRGRPIKPVSLVLMNTMIILGCLSIFDAGILGSSRWADILGGLAFIVAGSFMTAWVANSQILAEWALLGAFFVWGFRVWAIMLTNGWATFSSEGIYLSFLWILLAGGSWLLERSDDTVTRSWKGDWWTQRSSRH